MMLRRTGRLYRHRAGLLTPGCERYPPDLPISTSRFPIARKFSTVVYFVLSAYLRARIYADMHEDGH